MSTWRERLRARAADISRELYALYLAYGDPRTPWYARIWSLCVVAYALSPIDLIPDFIPVLGYLDDLLLLPLGVWLAMRMIPRHVMEENRARAGEKLPDGARIKRLGLIITASLWLMVLAIAVALALRYLG
ncbi:MAG: YkvA family protein [Anaerolineae bacterium]